jgi:hypothetical protein
LRGIITFMQDPPRFLTSSIVLEKEETFQPELIPFRGGWIAWGAVVLIGFTLFFIRWRTGEYNCMTINFFLFFLLAAILITFNYWIDSNTIILATPSHLSYQSPIKKFFHPWDEITQVKAVRVGQSWRVSILGQNSSFSFRIKSETVPEDHRGRILELPRGETLAQIICTMANLTKCTYQDKAWICEGPS